MAINVLPVASAASKTMFRTTLTSGTSWTVPAGVTYVNVTLVGGGGGGGQGLFSYAQTQSIGLGGQIVDSTQSTTPGTSISYSIGAGGTRGYYDQQIGDTSAGYGGTTTFTGATSAFGGGRAPRANQDGVNGNQGLVTNNGGGTAGGNGNTNGAAGGAGCIVIEYWA